MSIKIENFEFSSDVLNYSEVELKALLKGRYKLSARKSKEIYKAIHGDNSTISTKATATT